MNGLWVPANFLWIRLSQNSFLQTLDGGGREELLARLLVYPGRRVFDDVKLAEHRQHVGNSLLDQLLFTTCVHTVLCV